jgi:pimeloyl-ACP methyl ester carboxylesterase
MKNRKQIIAQILTLKDNPSPELDALIWKFICYPPKMPLRQHQEQLLAQAAQFSLTVNDPYFSQRELTFNGFTWGSGSRKIMITHGWGSKAADFSDVIIALLTLDDVQIISWDAPANGSSEGELSNLLLFVQAITAVIGKYGKPDILIGHSIGAMANVVALNQLEIIPALLVSITPLITMKENFAASMTAVGIPEVSQTTFLDSFEEKYGFKPDVFNMDDLYHFGPELNHWLAYDILDLVSPFSYMEHFLDSHPEINTLQCDGAGHDRIIKSEAMIGGLTDAVKQVLQ